MSEQNSLNLEDTGGVDSVEKYKFEPIKGYPMLNWHGKRPFTSTQYYPAQKKEVYGEEVNGWINKIFWGDNLQVMSHLLKEYRGKIKFVYIDPPFDSKADYKKKIKVKSKSVATDQNSFEEKQYTDIWTNDEYLQFMYERIVLLRELLSDDGGICIHLDQKKSPYIRLILDEIFGAGNFRNEIIWHYGQRTAKRETKLDSKHDNILFYSKSDQMILNETTVEWAYEDFVKNRHDLMTDEDGEEYILTDGGSEKGRYKRYVKDVLSAGKPLDTVWSLPLLNSSDRQRVGYPTQKPDYLIERILRAFTYPGDLVFDCFMGSGTTQAVSMKIGRKFIGADINFGAVQTTSKRLLKIAHKINSEIDSKIDEVVKYCGFEVSNVNNYDVFRNPVEAKSLLLDALEIESLTGSIYDGKNEVNEKSYMVKIMPVNRIATREDLNELVANFPYKVFEQRKEQNPTKPVESIMLICMGHEPNLKADLEHECGYKLNVEVVDILRDKSNIEFKRDSEAEFLMEGDMLKIIHFFPMNLMQKLSLQKESVSEWRELVESIVIDWNYDGAAMEPTVVDIPDKNEFVLGEYKIPDDAGTIKIKITDLLSESYEEVIKHG